jgi:hypothetical protein
MGATMQRGPPRPRPSSEPGTVMTSIPVSRRPLGGADVALVRDHPSRRQRQHVGRVGPVLALGRQRVVARVEQAQAGQPQRAGDRAGQVVLGVDEHAAARAGPQGVGVHPVHEVGVDDEGVAVDLGEHGVQVQLRAPVGQHHRDDLLRAPAANSSAARRSTVPAPLRPPHPPRGSRRPPRAGRRPRGSRPSRGPPATPAAPSRGPWGGGGRSPPGGRPPAGAPGGPSR